MSKLQFWWAHFIAFRWPGRKPYRPLLRAEFAAGDLFGEAAFLLHAGYRVAAVATSRSAVERLLKRTSLICPGWKTIRRPTVNRLAIFLVDEGLITLDDKRAIDSFNDQASTVVHSGSSTATKAVKIVAEGERLRALLLPAIYNVMCRESTPDPDHDRAAAEWAQLSRHRIASLDLYPIAGSIAVR